MLLRHVSPPHEGTIEVERSRYLIFSSFFHHLLPGVVDYPLFIQQLLGMNPILCKGCGYGDTSHPRIGVPAVLYKEIELKSLFILDTIIEVNSTYGEKYL